MDYYTFAIIDLGFLQWNPIYLKFSYLRLLYSAPPALTGITNNGNMPLSPITIDPSTENTHGVYSNSIVFMYSGVYRSIISV